MSTGFYQTLEASETASQETLQTLYECKRDQLQQQAHDGNPDAEVRLWALNQAYETLSKPQKRSAYDQSLRIKKMAIPQAQAISQPSQSVGGNTAYYLVLAMIAASLVGLGLHLGRADNKNSSATQPTAQGESTGATVENQQRLIETQIQVANRMATVEESAESRRARALEHRANVDAENLKQNEERLKLADEHLKWTRRQYEKDSSKRHLVRLMNSL